MKDYLREALTAFGGQVTDAEHGLSVVLPEEGEGKLLAEALGQPELELVFEAADVAEGRELIAPGSHVLRVLDGFLAARGQRSYVVQPAEARLTKKALGPTLKPAAGHKLTIGKRAAREGYDLYVVYRLRYRSRERVDELLTVRVEVRPALDPEAPDRLRAELAAPPVEVGAWALKPRKQAPDAVLAAALQRADAAAAEEAGKQAAAREAEARKGFSKDLSRLHAYYAGQIAEYGRRRRSDLSQLRIEELEEERELRVRELAAAAEVKVEVEPLQLLTVEVPLQSAQITVGPKSGPGASAAMPIVFDRAAAQVSLPACPACERSLAGAKLAPCGSEHLVHDDCLGTCARCEASACTACVDLACAVCESRVCSTCAVPCGGCGEQVCKEHQGACATCDAAGCEACLKTCASCDRAVCADDRVAIGAGTQAVMCTDCARACPGCGTATVAKELRRCDTCGRRFCSTCHPQGASACTLCLA